MTKELVASLILLSCSPKPSFAQFPFEKFKQIKYRSAAYWKPNPVFVGDDVKLQWQAIVKISKGRATTIRITSENNRDVDSIIITRGNRVLLACVEPSMFSPVNLGLPIRVADFNSDGLEDMKFVVSYHGCGLAAMFHRIYYLIQKSDGGFYKVSFDDMLFEDMNRRERDMDGDGNYEIITMAVQYHKEHNYWTFNIYNIAETGLVNRSKRFGYPIMVQYLNRQNFRAANIAQSIRERFVQDYPHLAE